MIKKSIMEMGPKTNEQFDELVKYCMASGAINLDLYEEYDVKRGLRDANGKGVLTGLTEISDVVSYKTVAGRKIPSEGSLYYQGYNVNDLVAGFGDMKFGFEETTYLLLFGELPNKAQLDSFKEILAEMQELSGQFIRDVIMKAPSSNIMNALQKGILTLYHTIRTRMMFLFLMYSGSRFSLLASFRLYRYMHTMHIFILKRTQRLLYEILTRIVQLQRIYSEC